MCFPALKGVCVCMHMPVSVYIKLFLKPMHCLWPARVKRPITDMVIDKRQRVKNGREAAKGLDSEC